MNTPQHRERVRIYTYTRAKHLRHTFPPMQIIPLFLSPRIYIGLQPAPQKRRSRFYGSTSAANKIEFAHTLSQVENCNNFIGKGSTRILMGRALLRVAHKHSEVLKGGMSCERASAHFNMSEETIIKSGIF